MSEPLGSSLPRYLGAEVPLAKPRDPVREVAVDQPPVTGRELVSVRNRSHTARGTGTFFPVELTATLTL